MTIRQINKLSIIVPCYNEAATLETIIEEVLAVDISPTKKEIILIDDKSSDSTANVIEQLAKKHSVIKPLYQSRNIGKGAALVRGIKDSTGDVLIIQDADREYDPRDYMPMLKIFREDRADIVFGSRFSGGAPRRVVYLTNTIANKMMTRLSALLNGLYVSDIHTCYIMFDGDWIRERAPKLSSKRFGFNPEVVAKIAKEKENLKVCETSVSYYGRTKGEGKKIGAYDGVKAIIEIIYYNLFSR